MATVPLLVVATLICDRPPPSFASVPPLLNVAPVVP